jgi:signal transduction histidine kinase
VLAEVSLLLASSGDYVTILHKLTDIAVPLLGDWCSVHVAGSSGELERVAMRETEAGRTAIVDGEMILRVAAQVFAQGNTEWADRVVSVPLFVRGRVIGVLTLVRAEGNETYDRDDAAFAEELARRVAMYIDNALLLRDVQAREAALRDEATRLETLNRIGQELAAIHDLDDVVKRVCDAATALTHAEIGLFYVYADGEAKHALCGATSEEADAIRRNELNLDALSSVTRVRSRLAVPVRDRNGDVIGGIVLGHSRAAAFDVRAEQLVIGVASLTATATESARLFREARELIAALEKSNHDLDQFAYVTSHDLRAPLRGIANLGLWMEEDLGDKLTDKSREYLTLLRGRIRRLEDLIQGVLDYSRAGRVADAPSSVDVGVMVRQVVDLVGKPEGASIVIDPNLPTLCTTRVPLQQVFMNLIGNAFKYNLGASPRVQVGAEPIANGWEFYVRDNGPGIAARYHARIWGLFQTLHSRDRIESTGMGLAIVRKIVEAHGGRAWIESKEGEGSTFRFTWPKDPPRSHSWDRHMRKR